MLRKFLILCTIATISSFGLGTQAQMKFKPLEEDPQEINFGLISTESTSNLKKQWMPLMQLFIVVMERTLMTGGRSMVSCWAPMTTRLVSLMELLTNDNSEGCQP